MGWLIYKVLWKSPLYGGPVFAMLGAAYPALAQTVIPNPIGAQSFPKLIDALATALIQIGGVLAVVAIVIVGFKFLTASVSGDTKSIGEAKKMLWWVLIGTAIVVGSSVLAKAVINTIETLGKP